MAKGIYKRGSVYWIRYAGLDGKLVRESTESSRFKDAEYKLIKRKNSIKEGIEPEVKRIKNYTFNQLADEYRKWAERQRSFKSKIYLINQLADTFGSYPLRRISPMLIEQYQTKRLQKSNRPENGKPVTGNKPATVNRLTATIKHMFTKAVEWDMVEEGTFKRISKVKLLPENNKRLRYLSKEQCRELINACEPHLKPIVTTAMNTGMRKGEILSLKWDNVDLKHGFILLDITKNGERREVPINNTLKSIFKGIPRRIDSAYVFYNQKTGKPYKDVKRSFQTALKRSKIVDFRFHDLRHTFASHLIMANIDLTTVKELLGHKDIKMTLRYAHLAPSHKVKAVDVLDNVLNRSTAQLVHNRGNETVCGVLQ